ncbi:hypothetical protein D3C73_1194270 [compost metagenome]
MLPVRPMVPIGSPASMRWLLRTEISSMWKYLVIEPSSWVMRTVLPAAPLFGVTVTRPPPKATIGSPTSPWISTPPCVRPPLRRVPNSPRPSPALSAALIWSLPGAGQVAPSPRACGAGRSMELR